MNPVLVRIVIVFDLFEYEMSKPSWNHQRVVYPT